LCVFSCAVEEGYEHQLFFSNRSSNNRAFNYAEKIKMENPLVWLFTLTTGTMAATGNIVVILRHKPSFKDAAGCSDITTQPVQQMRKSFIQLG
jgi:hypothetical protein